MKPFYIRKTPEISDADVVEVFNLAVKAGAALYEYAIGLQEGNSLCNRHHPEKWGYFGVNHRGYTYFSDEIVKYGTQAVELTVDQVPEFLGIEHPKPEEGTNKYQREIKPGVYVDVYDIADAYELSPAIYHAVKKLLIPGGRGAKSEVQDLQEAIGSVQRRIDKLEM